MNIDDPGFKKIYSQDYLLIILLSNPYQFKIILAQLIFSKVFLPSISPHFLRGCYTNVKQNQDNVLLLATEYLSPKYSYYHKTSIFYDKPHFYFTILSKNGWIMKKSQKKAYKIIRNVPEKNE